MILPLCLSFNLIVWFSVLSIIYFFLFLFFFYHYHYFSHHRDNYYKVWEEEWRLYRSVCSESPIYWFFVLCFFFLYAPFPSLSFSPLSFSSALSSLCWTSLDFGQYRNPSYYQSLVLVIPYLDFVVMLLYYIKAVISLVWLLHYHPLSLSLSLISFHKLI